LISLDVLKHLLLLNLCSAVLGWLGWINSWGETTTSVSVGNWAINNIPYVSVIISP